MPRRQSVCPEGKDSHCHTATFPSQTAEPLRICSRATFGELWATGDLRVALRPCGPSNYANQRLFLKHALRLHLFHSGILGRSIFNVTMEYLSCVKLDARDASPWRRNAPVSLFLMPVFSTWPIASIYQSKHPAQRHRDRRQHESFNLQLRDCALDHPGPAIK